MQSYVQVSLILCLYGFLREMRPSEPFVTEYLLDERWHDIDSNDLNRKVYPLGTYFYLAQLVIIFLITDILRYKPIIILASCFGIIEYCILLWTKSLFALQVGQAVYGTYMAGEIAYYTYMYARVDRLRYQQVTGYLRAAILAGRFSASALGQILVSFELVNLRNLNYITLGAQTLTLPLGIILPSVGISLYFYSNAQQAASRSSINGDNLETNSSVKLAENNAKPKFSFSRAKNLLWTHFTQAYSNPTVLQSSLWWALAMAGFLMIQTYAQLLWSFIDNDRENLYNGGVEAILTLLGALAALLAGHINMQFYEKFSMYILTFCALLEGTLILVSAYTNNVIVAYVMYISFGVIYNFMITLASAHVAKHVADDSSGLIFGINTFVALLVQTILTVLVASEDGFSLNIQQQYITFGSYFIGLAGIYGIVALVQLVLKCSSKKT